MTINETDNFIKQGFNFKMPINYNVVLEDEAGVSIKPFVERLDCFKRCPDTWGSKFQSALVRISESAFNLLNSNIYKNEKSVPR